MKRLTSQGALAYVIISGITIIMIKPLLTSGERSLYLWPFALLIYLVGVVIFTYWLDYHTTLIVKLNEMVKDFAKGYLTNKVIIPRNDELGELNSNLRFMADRLNQHLEKTIQDRDQMETILASMVEGVLAFDHTGKLLRINRTGEEMLKVTRESVENRYFLEIIRNHQLADLLTKGLNEGKRHVLEEIRLSPMEKAYYRVYITPILGNWGKKQGAIMVLRDITKVRNLEQIRSEFIANVSHELRTPLTSIKGYVETLLDGAMEDQEVTENFLTIINSETDRLTRLINDLLDLSQLETGQTEVVKKSVDSQLLLTKVSTILQPLAQSKRITIQNLVKPGASELYANQDMLEQALINLLDNAIKYSPAGETISVSIAPTPQGVNLQVADHGSGIPAESLPRLFERFYRVDKARSRLAGGTGLGLSIVKHIVDRHWGHIEVESEEGQGTVFTVFLPKKPEN